MKTTYIVILRRNSLTKVLLVFTVAIVCSLLIFLTSAKSEKAQLTSLEDPAVLVDPAVTKAKLSIIIDDFGATNDGVEEMMAIDRHITFAIIPFLQYSNKNAELAHEKNYEVIVHLPMEPKKGKLSWLGPNPILSGMGYDKVREIVKDSVDNVPYAVGVNIHMGSKASAEREIVSAILDEVKERNLYFVDSRTADKPVAMELAGEKNVLCYNRDVFLDGQQPKSFVIKRLRQAGDIALKNGYAVAIGHVGIEGGKVTAEAITEMLPEFDKQNIELVFISELLDQRSTP